MADDDLSRKRKQKRPRHEKIRDAVNAIQSCNKPLKGGGRCKKPAGHLLGRSAHK